MKKHEKIIVLGAKGFVGSALVRELLSQGYTNVLSSCRSELDLLKQKDVLDYFEHHRAQHVFMAAAKVGGIYANNEFRADFICQNLTIQNNVFQAAFESNIDKLLFLGSACVYPKDCPQPIKEDYLLTGPLEPTNEPYAVAKIAGLKLAESFRRQYKKNYISVMPTNLYGINDNFHRMNSHVVPGLIARMRDAMLAGESEFRVWGSGRQRREFLCVDDLAKACVFLMQSEKKLPHYINVGTGKDVSIRELAELIARQMGFQGRLIFDQSMPDGVHQRLLDTQRINDLGWFPKIPMEEGIQETLNHYLQQVGRGQERGKTASLLTPT